MKLLPHAIAAALLLSFSAASHAEATLQTAPVVVVEDVTVKTAVVAEPAELAYSNKWRIKFDNRTDSAGDIVFRFVLENATPIDIKVTVAKGITENDVAKLVENALRSHTPKGMKVKRVKGEAILLRFKNRFSLSLVTNSVDQLDVRVNKE